MQNQIGIDEHLQVLKNCFVRKDREVHLKSFAAFATVNKHIVINALSRVHPCESEIFWNFFEAVFEDISYWSDFILSELMRLLCAADSQKNSCKIISSLEAFEIFIDVNDYDFQMEVCNILKAFMATKNDPLRKLLMWLYASYSYKLN